MEKKEIQIALLGLGTVGGGVYKVIKKQEEEMERKLGAKVVISKILVRNIEKASSKVDDPSVLTTSWEEIVEDPMIQIVVEVIGGIEPAKTYILDALRHGKQVVTANKDLIASEGKILMDTAGEHRCDFFHEAAVAGGIPILHPLKECLAGNHISEVMGIVNGTTNFILTKMSKEGMEFESALKLAQELGYAESDPTADVEGLDAARKMAILASVAFNSRVTFNDVYTEGITKITASDMKYANEMGWTIKLLGIAANKEDGIEVRVHPVLIENSHPLASVNDSYNAVFVQGDAVQDVMFYGRGAGELPTASAVVGDIFDIVRNILHGCTGKIGCTCYKEIPVKKMKDVYCKYFIRMQVEDKAGVLAKISSIFGNNTVSLEQVVQCKKDDGVAELVMITDGVKEGNFTTAVDLLKQLPVVHEISTIIRVV